MPANDREVFKYLISLQDTPEEIAQIAYAIFANERRHWCDLFENKRNREPTQEELDKWVSELTEYRFMQMRDEAVQFFDAAAREYLAEEIEAIRQNIFNDTIIKEVKAAGNFWRQLWMQTITAIAAPVIIGLVIAAALVWDRSGFTISTVSETVRPPGNNGGTSQPIKPSGTSP